MKRLGVAWFFAVASLASTNARAEGEGEGTAPPQVETHDETPWLGPHFAFDAAGGGVVLMTNEPARAALAVGPAFTYGTSETVELRIGGQFVYWAPDPGFAVTPEMRFHLGERFMFGLGPMIGALITSIDDYSATVNPSQPIKTTKSKVSGYGGPKLTVGVEITSGLSLSFQTGALFSGVVIVPLMGGLSYRF